MFSGGVQFNLRLEPAGECNGHQARLSRVREGGKVFGGRAQGHPSLSQFWLGPRTLHTMAAEFTTEILATISAARRSWTALREAQSISGFSDWQDDYAR